MYIYILKLISCLKKKKERRTYTRETKLKAIGDHIPNGRSFRQIAIDLMLSESNIVSDWVNMYKEKGSNYFVEPLFVKTILLVNLFHISINFNDGNI